MTALPRVASPVISLPAYADLNLIGSTAAVMIPVWIIGLLVVATLRGVDRSLWLFMGAVFLLLTAIVSPFWIWPILLLNWAADLALVLSALLLGSVWVLLGPRRKQP